MGVGGGGRGAQAGEEAVCTRLRALGAANLFGPQRFGKYGDNAALGEAILLRQKQVRDRFLRRMALSALQSELFNRCLAARRAGGLFSTALRRALLQKRPTRRPFGCGGAGAPTPRR